jgi:hypothetical protein
MRKAVVTGGLICGLLAILVLIPTQSFARDAVILTMVASLGAYVSLTLPINDN